MIYVSRILARTICSVHERVQRIIQVVPQLSRDLFEQIARWVDVSANDHDSIQTDCDCSPLYTVELEVHTVVAKDSMYYYN